MPKIMAGSKNILHSSNSNLLNRFGVSSIYNEG